MTDLPTFLTILGAIGAALLAASTIEAEYRAYQDRRAIRRRITSKGSR